MLNLRQMITDCRMLGDIGGSGMDENWHSISYKRDASTGAVWAEACAKTGSPWFSGHFPAEPILPGIAILSMVTDVIRQHESEKRRRIRISGVRKVRFRLPVRPDALLTISLSLSREDESLSYHFKVELNEKAICTGVIVAKTLPEEVGGMMHFYKGVAVITDSMVRRIMDGR